MSRKDYIVQANMSLQLANIFLPLLFHLCLRVGAAENTAVVFDVNQTPPCIRAMEGSEFTIECTFNTDNNSVKWFAAWSKTRNNVTEEVCHRADRIILSADKEERSLSLTVKKADVTDSGTYVCGVGNKNVISPGNGTEVTIDEITDLLVNQTPTNFSDLEGSELTMNCTFKTVNNHSTMRVRWYNYGTEGLKKELVNENDVITTLHLDNGFASLTLKNANSSNTGTYICEVGITARNLYNNGSGTQVTIENFPELTVNQTPGNIDVCEGSDLTVECRFMVLKKHNTLYVKWYKHNGTGGTKKELMSESGWDSAVLALEKGFVSFALKNVNVTDTGTYLCEVGSTARNWSASGAGTQVTITQITDLMVNQTPTNFSDLEGSELTMNCTFKTVNNHSTMRVRWYNYGTEGLKKELVNESDVITTLHLDNGFASLTLKNANSSNTGTYICEVGITARNLYNNGSGTQVTIENFPKLTVNQTPGNIDASEGSDLTMECRFTVLKKHNTLYVKWYKHNGTGGTKKELMSERGWGSAAQALEEGFVSFALKNVNVTDTGTYVCEVGSTARNWSASGAGTQVTITPVDLLVNQTPAVMNGLEGKKLTVECRFKVVKDSSTMYSVTWYKKGADGHENKLKNGTGIVTTVLDSSKGLASLTLIKINRNDSGLYRCDFGKNGVGNGTRVTIQARAQWLMSSYIVAAAAAGTILFLLVLGILLWRWRQCSKEPLQSRSEAEMTQMETSSPPPADEVTYVDLNFHKRDTKAEEEVVYTEVKIRPKQRDDNVIYAKVNPHHH
ncbi:Fc receptor-like protein 5 isoform X2 [Chelonia mydas]|uniref:Fc receptor-like protein 5 isoform X2 n=1 Tax=Chelonia mydas TaxID=8469 RepID=UPI0018A243AD|nr:Fc receptor-like protein 5 isoform X2 [Chelonia mydas]